MAVSFVLRPLLLTFPRKGTETVLSYLHKPFHQVLLLTFPRKGTETFSAASVMVFLVLHIITYISP